ncbi:MAG: PucR family transcriptional regulator [Oscillospiraceae bacterium]
MKLCAGMVLDGLGVKCLYKNYMEDNDPLNLSRYEIFSGQTCLTGGVLYLASGGSLPEELTVEEGAALISIGMPPEFYKKGPLRLIVVDEDMELVELANGVSRIFFEYNSLELRLQEAVNQGKSIQYMVELMYPFVQNTISVHNSEFRMIAVYHGPEANKENLKYMPLLENKMLSPEIVNFFKNDINFTKVKMLRRPFIYEASIFPWPSLDMNIFYLGEFAARIGIMGDQNPFRYYDFGLIEFFAGYVQLVFDQADSRTDLMPHHYMHMAEICTELLNGNAVQEWELNGCLSNRDWNKNDMYLCACILPGEWDYYNNLVRYYVQLINREYPGCFALEFNRNIAMIVNLKYYENSMDRFLEANIESMRDLYFRIGFSNVFKNFSLLKPHFGQARIALEMGLDLYPSIWYHKFSDLLLKYMLSRLGGELDERYVCSREVLLLQEYDRENKTDYLHTLRTFLDHGANIVQTAKALFIHRAIMTYRLNRIKELTKMDFKDSDKMLEIAISLRLLDKVARADNSA